MAGNQPSQVDISGMLAAQPAFENALAETTRTLSSMEDQRATLEASWTGDASTAFINAFNSWLENYNVVKQQLQLVTEKLEANTGNYQRVHSATQDDAHSWAQAVNGLPGF